MTTFLTTEDVLKLHEWQIATYGGSLGIREIALLNSALAQPNATFGGSYLHATLEEMAAAYLFHIVQNHPFVDGNKRTGLAAALIFLELNDVQIETDNDTLTAMVLSVANGEMQKPGVAQFFQNFARPLGG